MRANQGLEAWRRSSQRPQRRPWAAVVGVALLATAAAAVLTWPHASSKPPAPPASTAPPSSTPGRGPGTRLQIGEPGDVVVTGRWTCGAATAAVLRPATGQIFRFDDWARPGQDVVAVPVATVPGATGLRATPARAPSCDELEAVGSDGRSVRVPVAG